MAKGNQRYIYIITDKERCNLHIGLCSDMIKTLAFYEQMPSLFFSPEQMLNVLVYFELVEDENAIERYKFLCVFTRDQKEQLIKSINSGFVDIRSKITDVQC